MPPKSKQEKPEDAVRKLAKIDSNKVCADCTEKMPSYVNLTYQTFVCTKCAGVHRELQFRVKGISMSTFTPEEVIGLQMGGNANHNAKFLARHNPRDYPIPNGSDTGKLKEFVKMKYSEKKWYSSDPHSSSPAEISEGSRKPAAAPAAHVQIPDHKPASVSTHSISAPSLKSGGQVEVDLLNMFDPTPVPTPASQTQTQQTPGFDAFASPAPSSFNSNAPSGSGFDLFTSPTPPSTPANKNDSAFGFTDFGPPPTAAGIPHFSQNQSGFPAFAAHAAPPAPMPFIHLNPGANGAVAPPVPVPEPVQAKKDFSAFDNISSPVVPQHHQQQHGQQHIAPGNPFDTRGARPPQAVAGNPFGQPGPGPAAYGHGYPGQQPSPFGPGPGQGYPPQGQGQFPPQHIHHPPAPYGYPPQQAPSNPFAQGPGPYGAAMPPQGPYPGGPFHQQQQHQQPPAAPPAPDPFANVVSIGWGGQSTAAAGSGSGNGSGHNSAAPHAAPVPQPQAAPVPSTNPFDLF
eukprot:gene764-1459_t